MHYTKNSIGNYQSGVEVMFRNSIHQHAIKETVTKYGYSEELLRKIYDLNSDLLKVVESAKLAKHKKAEVFKKKNDLLTSVKKEYMRYVKLARIVLGNNIMAEEALVLNGARARTHKEFVFQMTVFVSNLLKNKEWLEALGVFNIKQENIKGLENHLSDYARLSELCLEAQGEVKRLTTLKKKMLTEIQSYVSDYVKVVRIAFEEKPKLLMSLGIRVKE